MPWFSSCVGRGLLVALLVAACSTATSPGPTLWPSASGSTPSSTPAPTATRGPARGSANAPIAAGYAHSCAVTPGGGVSCWGANDNGQLGGGAPAGPEPSGPVEVVGLDGGVQAIAAGGYHTCALTSAGGVKCWGYNLYGQLGDGTNADSNRAVNVVGLERGVDAIATGWGHTCAVTSGGGVKCWGNNPFGGLGDGTRTDRSAPVDVSGLATGVRSIAAGNGHTCAVTSVGGVTCWGDGQADDPSVFHASVPNAVQELASGVQAVTASLDGTCALMADGDVICWGPNYGPPSAGGPSDERFRAIDLSSFPSVGAITSGDSHACALTELGRVACWGGNSYGQLGHFEVSLSATPREVLGLDGNLVAIASGGLHSCAMALGGRVQCWGFNGGGQLGEGITCRSSSKPVDIVFDPASAPRPTVAPAAPIGPIDHSSDTLDVVLRLDVRPDLSMGELEGEVFQPGPEFTLYGDGRVIFRDLGAIRPPSAGPIVRGVPFMVARLGEEELQELLRFALGQGGLAEACDLYENTFDTDAFGSTSLTIRAGDLARRIEVAGPNPVEALIARLRDFEPGSSVPAEVWVPDRWWGTLIEASPLIESGVLPDPAETGSAAWPWPGLASDDFVPLGEAGGWAGYPRRVMSADEAAALGLSDNGGVVQRIYLIGPDGEAVQVFSLWPMLPDEAD